MKFHYLELDEWYSTPHYAYRNAQYRGFSPVIVIWRNLKDERKFAVYFEYELTYLNHYLENNGLYSVFIANDIEEVQDQIDKFLIKMDKLQAFA
jgi:hypothetical protein